MDIYCRFCGEPWDIDCLYDMGEFDSDIGNLNYKDAEKRFIDLGCSAFQNGENKCNREKVDPHRIKLRNRYLHISATNAEFKRDNQQNKIPSIYGEIQMRKEFNIELENYNVRTS